MFYTHFHTKKLMVRNRLYTGRLSLHWTKWVLLGKFDAFYPREQLRRYRSGIKDLLTDNVLSRSIFNLKEQNERISLNCLFKMYPGGMYHSGNDFSNAVLQYSLHFENPGDRGESIKLNSIPLWEWTWCHCVFYVKKE